MSRGDEGLPEWVGTRHSLSLKPSLQPSPPPMRLRWDFGHLRDGAISIVPIDLPRRRHTSTPARRLAARKKLERAVIARPTLSSSAAYHALRYADVGHHKPVSNQEKRTRSGSVLDAHPLSGTPWADNQLVVKSLPCTRRGSRFARRKAARHRPSGRPGQPGTFSRGDAR